MGSLQGTFESLQDLGQLYRRKSPNKCGLRVVGHSSLMWGVRKLLTDTSWHKPVLASPKAHNTPGEGGTITTFEWSSFPRAQPCNGPAPPNTTRAKSRGSCPDSTLTTRKAPRMFSFAMRSIPSAASIRSSPSASATDCTALRAALISRGKAPSRSSGGRYPRTALASVTVACTPPRE